jgi:hypothetical protein
MSIATPRECLSRCASPFRAAHPGAALRLFEHCGVPFPRRLPGRCLPVPRPTAGDPDRKGIAREALSPALGGVSATVARTLLEQRVHIARRGLVGRLMHIEPRRLLCRGAHGSTVHAGSRNPNP